MPKDAKPGRPRKPPEQLTEPLSIRLTLGEREALGSLALRDGRSLSGYIASVLRGELGRPRSDRPVEEAPDFPIGETRQFAIRVISSERTELQRRADAEARSLSGYVVHVLRLHLARSGSGRI